MITQKVKLYSEKLIEWFIKGKYFWISFLCILSFLLITIIFDIEPRKNFFLYTGIILQLAGLITLVFGLNSKIIKFTLSNPIKYHFSYFKRFPRFKNQNITFIGYSPTVTTTTTEAELTNHLADDADIERKIEYILQELQRNYNLIQVQKNIYKQEISHIKKQIIDYKEDTDQKINEIQLTLKDVNVGSVDLELFGIFCFFVGIILSTIPHILASFY